MPYEFTQEAFSKFSTDVLNAGGDQATLTSVLADMSGTITDSIALSVANGKKLDDVMAENERLKKANMELFLRVGAQNSEELSKGQNTDTQEEDDGINPVERYMNNYFASLDATGKGD